MLAPSPVLSLSGGIVGAAEAAPEEETSSWSGKWGEKGWRPGGNLGNMFGDVVWASVFGSKYSHFHLLFWRSFCNSLFFLMCEPSIFFLLYNRSIDNRKIN